MIVCVCVCVFWFSLKEKGARYEMLEFLCILPLFYYKFQSKIRHYNSQESDIPSITYSKQCKVCSCFWDMDFYRQELEEILYWLEWAWASYLAEEKAIIEYLHIEEQQLKKHVNTSAILQPAYFIAIDNAKKCIVLSIRGTYAATDVLTDLQPHSEKFEGGFAHSGILSAARWILENECSKLQILLSDNPGYKLVLTGHSLGAGAACLLSYLFHESVGCGNKEISSRLGISSTMIECWGFGCPPCVDEQLCQNSMFIKNVVLQDDIVTRACVAALEDLRTEILQTNWDDVLEDGGTAKKLLNLVNSTNAALGHADRALGYTQGTLYQKLKSASYAAFVSSFRASVSGNRQPGPLYNFPPAQFGISQPYGPRGYAEPHHSYNPGGYHGAPNHCGPSSFSPCNMEGTPPGSLPGWVAIGSSILSSYLNSPGSDSMDTVLIDGESMVNGRLFVPGILFHIKRSQVETGRERGRASAKEVRVESDSPGSDTGSAPISMRHYVIKGWDPRGIIMKIVLSKSLLSDHSLVSYRDAIKDAIRWNQIVE
ncbi:hypothetical protein KP509_33G001800 [Ceratopteris richardii]|uniref:Fungal lipase-type domain-containing protein n=1 Tax=Ceratopteris richardii TaxID=49495 RepID=A0A8T2QL64_CERRI|nr:hypothetical protein KP509_33G001800 [Ceratopteris richardii]